MEKKVVLITGGTAGIGMQTAKMLAGKAFSVVIVGRNKSAGNQLVDKISRNGGEAAYVCADVSVENEVINMVSSVVSRFGRIDYLFNNAGTEGVLGLLESNTEEVIDTVLSVNIKGVLLCTKHILPLMKQQKHGVIINTASFVGTTMPMPLAVVYGASKSAVLSITQSVAASCVEDHIKVYAVCPWVTDTPMAGRLTGHNAEAKASFGASINPSGAIVPVEQIASIVTKLFEGTEVLNTGEAVLVDNNGMYNRINNMAVGDKLNL